MNDEDSAIGTQEEKHAYLVVHGFMATKDDVERWLCRLAGTIGHFQCGHCHTHGKARFLCPCKPNYGKSHDR